MDCKQIIVRTDDLQCKYLREFFSCQSKAKKFIDCCYHFKYSQIKQVEWAFKYFTQKCLNKEIRIEIGSTFDDAKEIFDELFHGSLKVFINKRIKAYLELNYNVCYQNADKNTQSLSTNNQRLAMLALNNCTALTKLKINMSYSKSCYLKLQNKKLSLQELIMKRNTGFNNVISDILKNSKDTLRSLECKSNYDLSPLRDSTQLRKLKYKGDIRRIIDSRIKKNIVCIRMNSLIMNN